MIDIYVGFYAGCAGVLAGLSIYSAMIGDAQSAAFSGGASLFLSLLILHAVTFDIRKAVTSRKGDTE